MFAGSVPEKLIQECTGHQSTQSLRVKPGSQYNVRRHKAAFVPIKIKFMECTRTWLLNSSCSDVLLAMQE